MFSLLRVFILACVTVGAYRPHRREEPWKNEVARLITQAINNLGGSRPRMMLAGVKSGDLSHEAQLEVSF